MCSDFSLNTSINIVRMRGFLFQVVRKVPHSTKQDPTFFSIIINSIMQSSAEVHANSNTINLMLSCGNERNENHRSLECQTWFRVNVYNSRPSVNVHNVSGQPAPTTRSCCLSPPDAERFVEDSDVAEAIRLMRVATQNAATDPRTGTIDMDMIATGQGASDRCGAA